MSVKDVDMVSEEVVFPCKSCGKSNSPFSAQIGRGTVVWLDVKCCRRDTLVHDYVVGLCLSL